MVPQRALGLHVRRLGGLAVRLGLGGAGRLRWGLGGSFAECLDPVEFGSDVVEGRVALGLVAFGFGRVMADHPPAVRCGVEFHFLHAQVVADLGVATLPRQGGLHQG